jgi:hypothetical protein
MMATATKASTRSAARSLRIITQPAGIHPHRGRQHGSLSFGAGGDWAWWQMLSQFLLPVLIVNMIGGTALFALLSYAQVMEEI